MKKQTPALFLFFLLILSMLRAQTQIGADIDSEFPDDESGSSVSISADGNRVAIGAPFNDGNGNRSGHVRVFELIGGGWTQIGGDIDGEIAEDQSGRAVSLSADGNRVAVGAHLNAANGNNSGHVRVFELIGGTWTQIGSDIDGEAAEDESGKAISLSSDGNRVAIGAHLNDGNGEDSGHVRVFEFAGGNWTQVGSDIDGEVIGDKSGWSVSLSSDGSKVAVGAVSNSANGVAAGHVRIFEFTAGTWTQVGGDIDGESSLDLSGFSVSLSANGNQVAIGAFDNDGNGSNSGHVRIYELIMNAWIQMGLDIDGEALEDQSGWSVSLSPDGSRVAIGAINNDGNGQSSGHVRVFDFVGGAWTQVGTDIDGEAAGDASGWSVSISSDGSRIAIGAPRNIGNGSLAGHVRVYQFTPLPVELLSFSRKVADNHVILYWQTTSEFSNKGFEILYSYNGTKWEKLAFVKGQGTTSDITSYQYTHHNPSSGQNYYRLKQLDFDGESKFSQVLVAKIAEKELQGLLIAPNPVLEQLTIVNGEGMVSIYNLRGQKIADHLITSPQTSLDLVDLPPGQYILMLLDQEGKIQTGTFVK